MWGDHLGDDYQKKKVWLNSRARGELLVRVDEVHASLPSSPFCNMMQIAWTQPSWRYLHRENWQTPHIRAFFPPIESDIKHLPVYHYLDPSHLEVKEIKKRQCKWLRRNGMWIRKEENQKSIFAVVQDYHVILRLVKNSSNSCMVFFSPPSTKAFST